MVEVAIQHGPRWTDITNGTRLPEHEIMRIKTYLKGTGPDDLVYVDWHGTLAGSFNEGEVIDRFVIVGEDGAGRQLRRGEYNSGPAQILADVPSIYFCVAAGPELDKTYRYVFIDCANDERPVLVCRRADFLSVFEKLNSTRDDGGKVWRGRRLVGAAEWRQLDESSYLFPEGLLSKIEEHTTRFLTGRSASLLSDWDVPPKRGVVLYGKPGNGKTILSRVAAKRALNAGINVVFLDVNMLGDGVGVSLRLATTRAPVLIILDDIDIHCGRRQGSSELRISSSGRQKFLADLLEFLDGVEPTEGYVILATTNALSELDPALTRPGRLGVHIPMGDPSEEHRRLLLQKSLKGSIAAPVPELSEAIEKLQGCTYADVVEFTKRYKIAVIEKHDSIMADQDLFNDVLNTFVEELQAEPVETRLHRRQSTDYPIEDFIEGEL